MHEGAVASWEQDLGRKHCALRVTLLYWVPSHNSDIAWEPPGAAGSVLFVPNRTGRTLPAVQTVKIKVSLFKLAASGGGFCSFR